MAEQSSVSELNENSTTDEVRAYADQVAKQVEADRAGQEKAEEKGDARITSEHADNEQPKREEDTKETPADTGSETARKGEDTGDQPTEDKSWMDDNLKAEVAAYGIDEAELADFASREELDRALRLFDKSALDAGRKSLAQGDDGAQPTGAQPKDKGQVEKKQEPKPAEDGRYEITLDKDEYDEALVDELSRMRDHYEARLEGLESRFVEADAVARERHFDNVVDSLGHADLFGKTDKETAKEQQRREDLFVEVETYLAGRAVLGRPAELNETIVNRIARSLFAEEFGKKDLKQRTRKISKQANGRQGGGATRPQEPEEAPRDYFDRLYRERDGTA